MGDAPKPPLPEALPNETGTDYVRRVTASLGTPIVTPDQPRPRVTEESRVLGPEGKRLVQRARAIAAGVAIVLSALTAAIVPAINAYHQAVDAARQAAAKDAQERAQGAKQLAESGYQVTKHVIEDLQRRVVELEAAGRGTPDPHRRLRGVAGKRPSAPAPAPKALPNDLDQAQRQLAKAAPPPAAPAHPAPDAGGP